MALLALALPLLAGLHPTFAVGTGSPVPGAPSPLTPTLTITTSPDVVLGGSISGTVVVANTLPGYLELWLWGPDSPDCSRVATIPSGGFVNGNGTYPFGPYTPTLPGTYRFTVDYRVGGDTAPVSTACDDPAASVVVTTPPPVTPTITAAASPDVVLGGSISSTAVLSGGLNPTGHIDFFVYGPDSPDCTRVANIPVLVPIDGNGSYGPVAFTPTEPGTYRWTVDYPGDADNDAVTTACDDPAATVVVTAPPTVTPTITTTASANVVLGGSISATAVLSGGNNPTGYVTFYVHGPDRPGCFGVAQIPVAWPVNGNGSYHSGDFTPTQPGTYQWTADYGGDANNAPAFTGCGGPAQTVVVTETLPPAPSISVDGNAAVAAMPAPGGTFTGKVTIANTGTEAVTLIALVDDDLDGVGTCSLPQPLSPGGTYSCDWPIAFTGDAGDTMTVPVTATVVDDFDRRLVVTDTFELTITDTVPTPPFDPSFPPDRVEGPAGPILVARALARTGSDLDALSALAVVSVAAGTLMLLATGPRPRRPSGGH